MINNNGGHSGIGIHAGRGNWEHATEGCFRTTEAGFSALKAAASEHPLGSIIVVDDPTPTHEVK